MQLTLTIDSATASADDYRRAASTLLHFGLGPGNASLTLDRMTISGDAPTVASALPADIGEAPPATPDPATVGFGAEVPSPGIGAAPPAPAATTPPPTTFDATGIPVDTDGLPHDIRIHSGNKTKNKDGRWKAKKNVDEATVKRVQDELRAIMNLPPPAPNGAPAPGVVIPAPPQTTTAPPAPPAAVTEAAPPAPAAPPPPATAVNPPVVAPAGTAGTITTFSQLMGWVGPAMASGRLPAAKIEEVMRSLSIVDGTGVGQLALLAARPDLVPGAYAALTQAAGGA